MNQRYSFGYLFLLGSLCKSLFFATVVADHHAGITFYETAQQKLQQFSTTMKDQPVDTKYLEASYDHATSSVNNVSDFVTTCISTSSVFKKGNNSTTTVKCNAALQMALVTYALLQGFMDVWHTKKQFYQQHLQMGYYDAIMKYPMLGIIQQQIIIMDHLIKMCVSGSLPERVFAKIHLVGMMLPEPYQRKTKKWSKKLHKEAFDEHHVLTDATKFPQDHPYKKFFHKVTQDWRQLLFKVHKMPIDMLSFYATPWYSLVSNAQNNMLLNLINAGRHNDADQLKKICLHNHNMIAQDLCYFYKV